ncbi:MAG: NADH-quinone oxidoreductase subunit A [Deltaproteobacteria bacterium]|nr:NADH-quinone oxidoreductase subunit A [Deltaproteobacteria bacterium]
MFIDFAPVLILLLIGTAFICGSLLIGALVRRAKPTVAKNSIYECGEPSIGSSWVRYNSRFYHVGLVYLLFDVEVVLLIPFALVFKDYVANGQGVVVLTAMIIFFILLTVGLIYEWFWGNLDWLLNKKSAHDEQ